MTAGRMSVHLQFAGDPVSRDTGMFRPGDTWAPGARVWRRAGPCFLSVLLCWIVAGRAARGGSGDWPRWRGPTSNGSAADCGEELVDAMGDAKLVWKSEDRGLPTSYWMAAGWPEASGYANPVVADGRVYFYYSRRDGSVYSQHLYEAYETGGHHDGITAKWWASLSADDVIMCLDAANGRTLWKTLFRGKGMVFNKIAGNFGPLNTPCVAGGRVYTMGMMARVYCVDAVTGRPIWESDLGTAHEVQRGFLARRKEATSAPFGRGSGAYRPGEVGFLTSSLTFADGVVVANAHDIEKGARGSSPGIVGLDGSTGRRLWYVPDCVRIVGASPVCWAHRGKEYAIAGARNRCVCVEPKTGKVLWEIKPSIHGSGTPAVTEDYAVFSGHAQKNPTDSDRGINCWRITPTNAALVWAVSPLNYSAGPSTSICIHKGHVYVGVNGLNGRKGGVLCINLQTGREVAVLPSGAGYSPIMAGSRFITPDGKMLFAHPYEARNLFDKRRGAPPAWSHAVWTTACIAGGRMYARGRHHLLCYDLRKRVALAAKSPVPRPLPPGPTFDKDGKKIPPWMRKPVRIPAPDTAKAPESITVASDPRDIEKHLESRYYSDRKAALRAFAGLDETGQDTMLPALMELLTEGEWPTRWAAALALEKLGDRAAVAGTQLRDALLVGIRKQSPGEIGLTTVLLHRCAPNAIAATAEPLIQLLKSADPAVVRHACIAVAGLGPKLPATRGALGDVAGGDDPWQAAFARRALEALDRDAAWVPLPMEGVRPAQLDYADSGNAESEKVRDEQW